jgi:CheY-like chemotaxis protein
MEPQGGIIDIKTGIERLNRHFLSSCYLDDKLPEGNYVYLEIRDQGCGMPQDVLIRVFDPFFSTKFPGRGLGLAAVLGIVRGHRGTMKVSSEVNRGSVFRVFLPATDFASPLISEWSPETFPGKKKSPMILVVDDEETVRRVAQKMLEKAGFTVLLACDGSDGMEKFKAHLHDIDLVLLDLSMPNMSGEEVFQNIRNLRQNIQVLLSSGYLEGEATHNCEGMGLAGFVQKPWQYDQLISAVQNAMTKAEAMTGQR